jgi:L-lactate dehydrogenase (cytochrome)
MAANPDLLLRYPTIADLAARAKKRIPFFAWEYLASGTGAEHGVSRNLDAFANITMTPQFMRGEFEPNFATTLFGRQYSAPFGIAPVGLTGLMWPGAEWILAEAANRARIPFSLSTVATETPETVGARAGDMGWFQLYPPRDPAVRKDLLQRASAAGFTTLLVTADVPAASQRERQKRAEVSVPPRRTLKTYARAAMCPTWGLATLQHGLPSFRMLEPYADGNSMQQISGFVSKNFGGTLSWEYLQAVRQEWPGEILVKGVLDVHDARRAVAEGMDGIVVSNHGARQLDSAPASISVLPEIAAAVGDQTTIVLDSGVRGGLDICRALALGADFVLLGRPFIFAVAALGEQGGDHLIELLRADLHSCMANLGCETLAELASRINPA